MATVQALFSGTLRVSSTSALLTKMFSATITCSTWQIHEIVLLPNVSDFVVSSTLLSNAMAMMATATATVRMNFTGLPSSVSAASAGYQFKDLLAIVGSGISGAQGIHLANSGADSATILLFLGQ